jgi:cytochrome c oxidase cbb3-type subunit III
MFRVQKIRPLVMLVRGVLPLMLTVAAVSACSKPATQGAPAATATPAGKNAAAAQRVLNASSYAIAVDADLLEFVNATAKSAVSQHCASCHGADLKGKPGVPNLVDGDWLWGVGSDDQNDVASVRGIEQTILYGVRNKNCGPGIALDHYGACPDTRNSEMPAFETAGTFTASQVDDLTQYVLKLSGRKADAAAVARAKPNWQTCTECHGQKGFGYVPYGGPNLTDAIWLYGGDQATIRESIAKGRGGVCPPWGKVLDAATIKSLAVYIFRQVQANY